FPLAVVDEPEALLEAVQLVQEAAHSAAPGRYAHAHEAKADEKGCPRHGTPSKDRVRTSSSVSNLSPQSQFPPDPPLDLWWVHSDSNRGLTGYEPVALDR